MKKYLVILIVGIVLIISALIYLMSGSGKSVLSDLNILPKPSPLNISSPAPDLTDTYKGTIVSFNNSLVSINVGTVRNFNITQTTDFQGVTYGSLEEGNAVTVPSSKGDLLAGKQVFVVTQKDTNIVKSIYIFR